MTSARHIPLFVAATLVSGLAAVSKAVPSPWLINETPSVPRGIYQRIAAPPSRGLFVSLAPPSAATAYLGRLGAPPDARLLKRVAATAGDRVCVRGQTLSWPSGAATALPTDRQGRALDMWRGCRALGADELLVLGESPASFDSRYFGPVSRRAVEGVYREVWRW